MAMIKDNPRKKPVEKECIKIRYIFYMDFYSFPLNGNTRITY